MSVAFRWDVAPGEIAKRVAGDDVLLFAAEAWHGLYRPFVPCDTGKLAGDVRYGVEGGMGVIEHLADYAVYQYAGRGGGPGLGSGRWDQAAKAVRTGALVSAVQAYVNGK